MSTAEFTKVVNQEYIQFKHVLQHKLGLDSRITLVIVQKTHNVRFRPRNPAYSHPKTGNLVQGVLLDSGIVSNDAWEFYLNSQAPLQGTNRAAKYTVLKDEIGFSRDGIALLINNFCYTFARATRSVKVPAPVYLAGLLAERARKYLAGDDRDVSDGASS